MSMGFVLRARQRRVWCCALVLALAGCSASVHHRAAEDALERGAFDEAVKEYQKAAELAPRDVEYKRDWLRQRELVTGKLLARAELSVAEGKVAEAEKQYRTILSYDKGNARALAGLEALNQSALALADVERGRDALKRGDVAAARGWADRALDRSPQLAEARDLLKAADDGRDKELPAPPSLGGQYKKPINLEFRDSSIKMVFDALSRTTGINFIFDRDVKPEQRTTVFLKQTTLEDAIDVILATNQLEKKVLNASSVLIYPNTPAKVKEHQDLLVKAFYLTNIDAKTAGNLLKSVLKLKDVYVDEKYHLIVLRENAETIALAEKLIALQDLEEPEVMLEVEVLEVNRNRLLNLGVQLTNQLTVAPLSSTTSTGTSSGSASTQTSKLSDILNLNADKLGITTPQATLSLQKTDGDANLLANPRMRVRDREKARILIGDKVPVVTTTTTPNSFLSESIQYLDVGLKLEVEPEIHVRDDISIKLSLEVSSVVGSVKTATGSQAYQIGTRNLTTALRLKDGETQILAGLISDADRSDANRIPLLGDIPLLGRLFSSQKDDRQKTEIVMSITPHLIRNIQRKGPGAEAFWSGTEANLRLKPIQLGQVADLVKDKAAAAGVAAPASSSIQVPPVQTVDTSGLQLRWNGPKKVKQGQSFSVELMLDSQQALRALPLQLSYNTSALEVVSVSEGDFFKKAGASVFNHSVDKASGRVSIASALSDGGTKGQGRLFTVELRALSTVGEAEIGLIGVTPIGQTQAVSKPNLPLLHAVSVE
ncbi:cohesin domain-containing protein [Massilia sp. TS11]|uniref:cohesin domain-containing protein n=1 Tax=Massilia sp. TS11 TaxID=2908003 RepID=UPI001EDB4AFB|nr:cohesin domain-containing protein [Massilia sp. TS11]MCG2583855.1 cohesin domain-containing protein [Massilia sp. TS11]